VGRLVHGLPPPTAGAASRPMCQFAWRSGCSAADRTITSSGGSAADVPPSEATGAAVEPLRALHCTRSSAARLRAWRVPGVAIWPSCTERSAAQRPAGRSVRQAGLVRAQREGNRARDPRTRERAVAFLSRLCRPSRVASGMEARQGARRRVSTRSATARPRAAGRRPDPERPERSCRCRIRQPRLRRSQRSGPTKPPPQALR
jgi:hypothetical protein